MSYVKTPRHSNKVRHNTVAPIGEDVIQRIGGVDSAIANKWTEQMQASRKNTNNNNNNTAEGDNSKQKVLLSLVRSKAALPAIPYEEVEDEYDEEGEEHEEEGEEQREEDGLPGKINTREEKEKRSPRNRTSNNNNNKSLISMDEDMVCTLSFPILLLSPSLLSQPSDSIHSLFHMI